MVDVAVFPCESVTVTETGYTPVLPAGAQIGFATALVASPELKVHAQVVIGYGHCRSVPVLS